MQKKLLKKTSTKFNYDIKSIINSGVTTETELDDVRRIRFVNILCLIAFVLTPLMFLYNSLIVNYSESYPLLFFSLIFVIGFIFNKRNKNQLASIILIFGGIICSYWVTLISNTQVGAPYFDILFGLLAINLLKEKYLKILIGAIAFLSFVILNAYQLQYKPFSILEYTPVLIMLVATFIGVYRYNIEFIRNELIIKQQAENVVNLQKEKHKYDLDLKQKDIDAIAANNRMQLKIREDILSKLGKINKDEGSLKNIKLIKTELLNQIETQRKLDFSEHNIEEVNARFFEKLNKEHPKLSKKERALCSYIKLQLSTKEIASLTNSSVNTIYVTKNRLKVKLNLKNNNQIDTYLLNF